MVDVDLTGDFTEVHKVTNVGATDETETLIAKTKGAVSISPSVTKAEADDIHNEEVPTTKNVRFQHVVEFSGQMMSSLQALTDLGILTSDSPPKLRGFPAGGLEGIRIKVFENKGDASAAQEWLLNTVEVEASNLEWPTGDFGTWECGIDVNGDVEAETLQS